MIVSTSAPVVAGEPATGQAGPEGAAAEGAKEEAKRHFDRGRALLREEAWDAALAEFMRSRALFPSRGNTQNAAVCLRKLHRYDEALEMFETFLRDYADLGELDKEAVMREIDTLRALVGAIELRIVEPGASVLIDGRDRGKTPVSTPLRVPAGSHVIRVFREGFLPFESRVEVAGGQTVAVSGLLLRLRRAGRLAIADRTGATVDVLVDGVVVGRAPWEGELPEGEHSIVLRGEGNLGTPPASAPVRLGEVTRLTLEAGPLPAQLRIEPTPIGASVAIDGVPVGRGIWDGRLREGRHRIEVVAEGFLSQVQDVSLDVGSRRVLVAQLERDRSSRLWGQRNPGRIFLDLRAAAAVIPSFGGDVAGGCGSGCAASVPAGVTGLLRGGYRFGLGVGLGVHVGYLFAQQTLTGRAAQLQPVSETKSPHSGRVDDRLRLQAVLVGVSGSYQRGRRLLWGVGLDAGVLIGSAEERAVGTFTDPAMQTYPATARTSIDARYFYLGPEARLGYRFRNRVRLDAGVQVLVLFAMTRPETEKEWPSPGVITPSDGFADFPRSSLLAGVMASLQPNVGVGYDF